MQASWKIWGMFQPERTPCVIVVGPTARAKYTAHLSFKIMAKKGKDEDLVGDWDMARRGLNQDVLVV